MFELHTEEEKRSITNAAIQLFRSALSGNNKGCEWWIGEGGGKKLLTIVQYWRNLQPL
jgi:hypothetical protein